MFGRIQPFSEAHVLDVLKEPLVVLLVFNRHDCCGDQTVLACPIAALEDEHDVVALIVLQMSTIHSRHTDAALGRHGDVGAVHQK